LFCSAAFSVYLLRIPLIRNTWRYRQCCERPQSLRRWFAHLLFGGAHASFSRSGQTGICRWAAGDGRLDRRSARAGRYRQHRELAGVGDQRAICGRPKHRGKCAKPRIGSRCLTSSTSDWRPDTGLSLARRAGRHVDGRAGSFDPFLGVRPQTLGKRRPARPP